GNPCGRHGATTILFMLIVLAGALPDASIASELARHLPQRAPTLHAWLTMGQAVWLVELAHLAVGTDRATLLPVGPMNVRAEESQALFETARPLFEGTGFAA